MTVHLCVTIRPLTPVGLVLAAGAVCTVVACHVDTGEPQARFTEEKVAFGTDVPPELAQTSLTIIAPHLREGCYRLRPCGATRIAAPLTASSTSDSVIATASSCAPFETLDLAAVFTDPGVALRRLPAHDPAHCFTLDEVMAITAPDTTEGVYALGRSTRVERTSGDFVALTIQLPDTVPAVEPCPRDLQNVDRYLVIGPGASDCVDASGADTPPRQYAFGKAAELTWTRRPNGVGAKLYIDSGPSFVCAGDAGSGVLALKGGAVCWEGILAPTRKPARERVSEVREVFVSGPPNWADCQAAKEAHRLIGAPVDALNRACVGSKPIPKMQRPDFLPPLPTQICWVTQSLCNADATQHAAFASEDPLAHESEEACRDHAKELNDSCSDPSTAQTQTRFFMTKADGDVTLSTPSHRYPPNR